MQGFTNESAAELDLLASGRVRECGKAVCMEIGGLLCVDALRGWPHRPYTEAEAFEYTREVTQRLRDAQIWRQSWDEEANE